MSDTPRTDEWTFDVVVKRGDAHLVREHYKDGSGDFVESDFVRQLERELNAANDRIKRLEEAGDTMASAYRQICYDAYDDQQIDNWIKAKEANP